MKTETKQNGLASALLLLSLLGRLLPHPANVTPVGAVSLVGGAKLQQFWRWVVPFFAVALSDYFLGWSFASLFVYASFAVNILLGSRIGTSNRYLKLGALSLVGSLQFFLLTNFGVWMEGVLYAKTFGGLVQCYTMALPFLSNTLLGDLCWSFGLFTLIDRGQVWLQKRTLQSATL